MDTCPICFNKYRTLKEASICCPIAENGNWLCGWCKTEYSEKEKAADCCKKFAKQKVRITAELITEIDFPVDECRMIDIFIRDPFTMEPKEYEPTNYRVSVIKGD